MRGCGRTYYGGLANKKAREPLTLLHNLTFVKGHHWFGLTSTGLFTDRNEESKIVRALSLSNKFCNY